MTSPTKCVNSQSETYILPDLDFLEIRKKLHTPDDCPSFPPHPPQKFCKGPSDILQCAVQLWCYAAVLQCCCGALLHWCTAAVVQCKSAAVPWLCHHFVGTNSAPWNFKNNKKLKLRCFCMDAFQSFCTMGWLAGKNIK